MGISRSLFNICIYVVVGCCLSMTHANFPSAEATSRVGGKGNETDQLALLAFKAKIADDPLQVMTSWNGSTHFCQWHGVTCDRRHKRVTQLKLQSQKLSGSISPYIGNLSFLRVLNLQNNSFEQEIPYQLGRLRRLQVLALSNNSISGNIPANLSACSNLFGLYLEYNNLVGSIPVELGSLSKLREITISRNDVTGNVPHSFMNLSSLESLYAVENNIGGSVPDALGQLKNLRVISLRSNRLSGTIPPSIFNLSSLTNFDVMLNNQIIGSLPSDIGITLPNIQYFSIASNKFTGSIPISISNASNLEVFSVCVNDLAGKVPTMQRLHKLHHLNLDKNHLGSGGIEDFNFLSSLTNATSLRTLSIDQNNFGGMLLQSVGNFSTKLEVFAVADNHIFGSVPATIGNLINLNWLNMWGNKLTGNIPTEIGMLRKLNILSLQDNQFSGCIPSSLGNLSMLNNLLLQNNNFNGRIPSSLGKCQNLLRLSLSNNNLNGTIPSQVLSLSSSIYLDFSQNHFIGSLPIQVGNLKNVGLLDVAENMLSSEIPSTIGSCVKLENLYMAGNFFQGSIPSSLSSLRGLQVLDLSRNNLSGKIPEYLEGFVFLQNLNLSYNDLEDVVPIKGVFANASALSVTKNYKLCGGIPELQLPTCNFKGSNKRGLILSVKLIILVASGLLGLTLLLCILFLYCHKKKREKPSSGNSGSLFLKVSYQSLQKATNGFSNSNLIGMGSFGSVYEGFLDQEGKKVAVKVLNLLRPGASKSFIAECEALKNIRHRNLVKVITACSSVDHQNNDFKALVYEFMVNGSLDILLHPIQDELQAYEEAKSLSLVQRLNIAIDVACALDYLHHRCQTTIIHCDLKPSNVLLDEDMIAHVGDFGISRFLLDVYDNNSGNQTSSIGIRGSVGYMPPEYGMGSEVSTSGDVYSFGILLLEMFTGKRPTDEIFSDGSNLHNYAKTASPDTAIKVADSVLLQQGEEGKTSTSTSTSNILNHSVLSTSTNNILNQSIVSSNYKIQECLTSIFRIGIACSEESPTKRLDITDVVAKLHVSRNNFLGTHVGRTN